MAQTVPLSLRFDEAEARAYLEGLAREIDRERQDASLQINGLRVAISPGPKRAQSSTARRRC